MLAFFTRLMCSLPIDSDMIFDVYLIICVNIFSVFNKDTLINSDIPLSFGNFGLLQEFIIFIHVDGQQQLYGLFCARKNDHTATL